MFLCSRLLHRQNFGSFQLSLFASKNRRLIWCAIVVFVIGIVVRLPLMPLEGTYDHATFKLWSYVAANNSPGQIYRLQKGVTATFNIENVKAVMRLELAPGMWTHSGWSEYVDYPPIIPLLLGLVGQIYSCTSPQFEDSRLLNELIKIPGLCFDALVSISIFVLIARMRLFGQALFASSIYWLNPLIVLGGPLYAYQDSVYVVPLILCLFLVNKGNLLPAWIFWTISLFTKPQAILALPALVAATASLRDVKKAVSCAVAVALVALVIMSPYIFDNTIINLVANNWRNASEPVISAQNCNLWWLITYLVQVKAQQAAHVDLWTALQLNPIMEWSASTTQQFLYVNAKKIGIFLYGIFVLMAVGTWWKRFAKQSRVGQVISSIHECAALLIYGQSMLLTQSHENHGYGAAAILLATWWFEPRLDKQLLTIASILSIVATLNILTFYGFGPNVATIHPHNILWLDFSVMLTLLNICLFTFWLFRWFKPVLFGADTSLKSS
jgi:hypothetical protein